MQAQNAITPAGTIRTEEENVIVRVSGRFTSEEDIRRVNFVINNRLFRLTDLGEVKRSYADPPQPMFRFKGQPAIGMGISMREGGDVLALGRNIERTMAEITADLPLGIEPHLVANQPEVVSHSVNEFMKSLWEAVAIVMAVSLLSLGLRAGTVVALTIPLVLAVVFVVMDLTNISLQRVSLGALIIALGLLVDDAMITVESMVSQLEDGWDKARAAVYAYATTHFPMGTGTLVTIAGFIPIGLAQSSAGEYTFSLFAVVAIALVVSWFVAAIFAPLIGVVLLKEPSAQGHAHQEGRVLRGFRRFAADRPARALGHDRADACAVRRVAGRTSACPAAVLSALRPDRTGGRSEARAERARSMRPRTSPSNSTTCCAATTTSCAGAPMWGAARSGSICRCWSSFRTTSSCNRCWSPGAWRRASACGRDWKRRFRRNCCRSSAASTRSRWGRRSDGRCSIG